VDAVTLSPRPRKALLAFHLLFSCGWVGMLLGYLALGLAAAFSSDPQTMRAAWIAMELTGWFVLIPLAVCSLVSGTLLALGTRWGLFRHYWVIFALALTLAATTVLIVHMPSVSDTAARARSATQADLQTLGGDLIHPIAGLAVLMTVLFLNVYKPQGVTPHGWTVNSARSARADTQPGSSRRATDAQ
jgi:hypothetical protein